MAARRGSIVIVLLAALAILAGTAATLLSGRGSGGRGSSTADGPGPAGSRGFGPGFSQGRESSRPASVGVLVLRFPERTPVAGAQVRLHTGPVGSVFRSTDAEGRASFPDAVSGRVRVDTMAEGFEPDQRTADLFPGENRTVEILLVESAYLEGRVVAAADGTPIAGARVSARLSNEFMRFESLAGGGFRQLEEQAPASRSATADTDGRFALRAGRRGGTVLLEASAEGFAAETAMVPIPDDPAVSATAEIRLACTGRIRGTVRDARGLPIEGATVRAMAQGRAGHVAGATSGSDGSYLLEGLAVDAVYRVWSLGWTAGRQKPGRPPVSGPVEVHLPADPGEATVDLVVPGVGTLKVDWADAEGRSDGGAHCFAFPLDAAGSPAQSASNRPEGPGFDLRLAGGRYRIVVETQRHGVGEAEAVVVEDAESRVRVTVGTGPALEGIVVDEEGRPVADALVRALRPADAPAGEADDPGWSAPAATIRVQEGPPGGVRVMASVLRTDRGVATSATDPFSLGLHQSRTDPGGRFRITGLRPGSSWLLTVRVSVFVVDPTGPFAVPTADIRLVARKPGALQGRLFLPAGAAVPSRRSIHFESASVAARGESTLRTTSAFGDGSFRIEDLPPGKGRLWAESETAYLEPVEVVVPSGETADAGILPMEPALTLHGRVVGTTGQPIARARVLVAGAEPVTTSPDGLFSIGGLRAGELAARVYAGSYDGAFHVAVRVTLPRADAAAGPLEIRIGTPGVIGGTARDAAGRPLAGWRVRARQASEPASHHDRVETVNHRGMYALRLPAGEWVVTLHQPGAAETAAEATVTMSENGRATVDFRLSPK